MAKKDPKVDAYIADAASFAKPILRRLRKVVHAGCPAVEETIKWGFPHFVYKGNIAGMAAFKQHCVFGFWKDALIFDREANGKKEAMGQFGRLTHVSELPNDDTLIGYVRRAVEINDAGIEAPQPPKVPVKVPALPADFSVALGRNGRARKTFASLSPGQRRDYLEWVIEAKRETTRRRRIATSIEWLAEGKKHDWKYEEKRK